MYNYAQTILGSDHYLRQPGRGEIFRFRILSIFSYKSLHPYEFSYD